MKLLGNLFKLLIPTFYLSQGSGGHTVDDVYQSEYFSENDREYEREYVSDYDNNFMDNIHSCLSFDYSIQSQLLQIMVSIPFIVGTISYGVVYFKKYLNELASSYIQEALTPNLPFCEEPFAMSPYMAQGASALAHLPYIPLFLLGVSYMCPVIIPTLQSTYSKEIKSFLMFQSMLQLFTSIGGHILPNPRVVMNQEISILLAFVCLFKILKLTTSSKASELVNLNVFSTVAIVSVVCYLTIGLMPVIFTCFAVSLGLGIYIKDAFGLLTDYGKNVLLATFVPSACVLVLETFGCSWLQTNISTVVPWHLVFDILFWQVMSTTVDLVVISPRPGLFLLEDV
jgi:hypothetical protein